MARPSQPRLQLEVLEDRLVLSTLTVTNATDTGVSGDGSLRGEILAAQAGDTIVFASGLAGQTITLTQGALNLNTNVTIQGLGATQLAISGNNASRVFDIGSSATVSITGLTIENGKAAANGGGVLNLGNLTLTNSWINNNAVTGTAGAAGAAGADGLGGGIFSASGNLTLSEDTISNNIAQGGVGGDGGLGVHFGGLDGGTGRGGGVYVAGGNVTLNNDTVSQNKAQGGVGGTGGTGYVTGGTGGSGGDGQGGGLFSAGGIVSLVNDTFAANSAVGGGGGVGSNAVSFGGGGGTGGNGEGGGSFDAGATLNLTNDTVADNDASAGSGGAGGAASRFNGSTGSTGTDTGGGIEQTLGSVSLLNTIVALNVADASPDVSGTFVSQGHNLIGNATGAATFNTAGDQVGTANAPIDPLLGPLQNNGGPTQTMALLSGSSALGAGDHNAVSITGTFDQRGLGFDRLVNGRIDIGAVQTQASSTTPPNSTVPMVPAPLLQVLPLVNQGLGGQIRTALAQQFALENPAAFANQLNATILSFAEASAINPDDAGALLQQEAALAFELSLYLNGSLVFTPYGMGTNFVTGAILQTAAAIDSSSLFATPVGQALGETALALELSFFTRGSSSHETALAALQQAL